MIGRTLSHYRIEAKLGAGGMGEVYQARDTKLKREVAIKVLPEALSLDADRIARFQREAELLASLNHSNIAAVYGFEESDGVSAIVLELVEGETLADRIARGPLPLDEALPIARQMVDALEAAHEKNVIHRDLKPANVKVTPDGKVKVLDFGLAKMLEPVASSASLTMSPTLSMHATHGGVILGTAAYMSPEQARGRPVDRRTDIWSFGCVLFEMLTGKRAFEGGETVSDAVAAILKSEPDWRALPPHTPANLRTLLRRCLHKDPQHRLPHIGTARLEIDDALTTPAHLAPVAPEPMPAGLATRRRRVALVAASLGVAMLAVAVAVWLAMRPVPLSPRPVTRFVIALPIATLPQFQLQPSIALSPDGTHLVFVARAGTGNVQLYSRASEQLDPVPIRGTEGGTHPFFSPDGQWIGFNADGKLKKVPAVGGTALTVCDAQNLRGATWMPDDSMVFRPGTEQGLWRVSASGGKPVELTKTDGTTEISHRWPEVLPGGKAIMFAIQRGGSGNFNSIGLLRLDTGERRVLVDSGSHPHYLPSGHLVFARGGVVLAVPFDVRTLQVKGAPVAVVEGVRTTAQGMAQLAVSATGVMAYAPRSDVQGSRTLVWVDRRGGAQPVSAPRQDYEYPRLSPDGQRLAVTIDGGGGRDIWLYQFARRTLSRLTFNEDDAETPVWTPDGTRVTYAVTRSHPARQIMWKRADGSSTGDEPLAGNDRHLHLGGWSPRGDALIATATDSGNLWILQMGDKPTLRAFLQTPFQIKAPTISPDGRWLAYAANDTNRDEIYVQAFPRPGATYQMSTDGGAEPMWAKSGRELFYRNGDRMMAVTIEAKGDSLEAGTPTRLFEGRFSVSASSGSDAWYDVSPDGQRFLMLKPEESDPTASIIMVQEWTSELKRLAPGK